MHESKANSAIGMAGLATAAIAVMGIAVASVSLAGEIELPQFSDQTVSSGLVFTHSTNLAPEAWRERHKMTPGIATADFNRDGWLDVFVNGGAGQNAVLFINNADGTFTESAAAWGIDLVDAEGASASVADINGDGYPDLYVGAFDGGNYLFVNNGDNTFTENAEAAGVQLAEGFTNPFNDFNTTGGAWGDIDLDGDLDLYTTQWWLFATFGNRLFINDGTGIFTESTEAYGLLQDNEDALWGFTPIFQDMNDDRYPELIIAADFGTSRYFINNAGSGFTKVLGNGTATDENGMGAAVGDYDNDGDPDWFVTAIYDEDFVAEINWGVTGNRLYRNDGAHAFTDTTGPGLDAPIPPDGAGVRYGYWGWGSIFGDFDHDYDLDLTMTNGFRLPDGRIPDPDFFDDPTRLWLNQGQTMGRTDWQENAIGCGINHNDDGKSLVAFDYDNDGDLDILISSNFGDLALYRNDIDQHKPGYDLSWLEVETVAPYGVAPDGVGAKIETIVNDQTLTRWVNTGGGFMSAQPNRVHFGFDPVELIDMVRITWPNGLVTTMIDVEPGAIILGAIGNINGDDRIDVADLGLLLSDFGGENPASDLNNDGEVNTADLGMLISGYGASLGIVTPE